MEQKRFIAWSIRGHGWIVVRNNIATVTHDISLATLFTEEYAAELHATGEAYCFASPF